MSSFSYKHLLLLRFVPINQRDIIVEHFVADFQDGTTEAVLTVHLLKDGLLWRTETGSTPVEKSKENT